MELDVENSYYGQKAKKLFLEGYNCSQSVFLAFEDKYDMDHSMAMKLSSSFGGGMGRLREVCGAVSGMFMGAGYMDMMSRRILRQNQSIMQEFRSWRASIGSATVLLCAGRFWGWEKVRMIRCHPDGQRSIIKNGHVRIWWRWQQRLWRNISGRIR